MATASFVLLLTIFSCYSCDYTYKYYPTYHLGPLVSSETKVGWMNDPNGFCLFNNEYHLFYQHNPNNSDSPGIVHWGHAKSPDLINWEHLPIALYPDQPYDQNGVYSGSAIVEDGVMYLYYTGNKNHNGNNSDYEQHQILATSDDGKTFKKYDDNPIIIGANHQPNFRDPKVWKHKDTYYMVLGSAYNNDTLGQALLFASKDKINWNETSVLGQSKGKLGYMWECPDLFFIDGRTILLFSPQGLKAEGDNYKNLYATGYIVGDFSYETNTFTTIHEFKELDHGHDFYATQTMITKSGERVLVAWMDMWEQNYPEGPDGFTGQLTIPRTLELTPDGRLLQQPLKEIEHAAGKKLHDKMANKSTKVQLESNAARVKVKAPKHRDFTLVIQSESANDTVTISYKHKPGHVILNRGGRDGVRRTKYRPARKSLYMTVFIDSSSIEVFCDRGEITMSSRFFPQGIVSVSLGPESHAHELLVHSMDRTMVAPPHSV